MTDWDNTWDKILDKITEKKLFPIVCLGKGSTAFVLGEKFKGNVSVIDRNFDVIYDTGFTFVIKDWGADFTDSNNRPEQILANFEDMNFDKQSIGSLFIPEIFLVSKKIGMDMLDKAKSWVRPGGLVAITCPSTRDVRLKNFRNLGNFGYDDDDTRTFVEEAPESIKVNPPVQCPLGCEHDHFSFYDFPEIESHLSSAFKRIEAVESIQSAGDIFPEHEGEFKTLLYVAEKI